MKIISTILYTIFIALVVGVAGLLLGSMLKVPGNIEVKIVKSGSMEPSIPTGSIVVVKPQGSYAIGDVITFGKDTKTDVPTTHRIVALNNPVRDPAGSNGAGDVTYTVKGDANEEADPNPVQRATVIGKVIFHLPYVGYLLNFARQPIGFTLLIAIPAGLVILEEIIAIVRETRKWWKHTKGDDRDDGASPRENWRGHVRKIYERRRKMDEIFVPMHAHLGMPFARRFRVFLKGDAYGTSTLLTLGIVFTSSLFAGVSGGTLSYFQDVETSVGNILQAGVWPSLHIASSPEVALFGLADVSDESSTGEILGASDEQPQDDTPTADDGESASDDVTILPELPDESGDSGSASAGTTEPVAGGGPSDTGENSAVAPDSTPTEAPAGGAADASADPPTDPAGAGEDTPPESAEESANEPIPEPPAAPPAEAAPAEASPTPE